MGLVEQAEEVEVKEAPSTQESTNTEVPVTETEEKSDTTANN